MEFTTTACIRPGILNHTYTSYSDRLDNVDLKQSTLYINVDPVGNLKIINGIDEVVKVAKKHFGHIEVNIPKEANFAAAILWCFAQPKEKYFFHLEDDWLLMRRVDINKLIKRLEAGCLQVILNKSAAQTKLSERGEPMFVPSLMNTKHIQAYLPLMNTSDNPEAQMKFMFRKNKNFPKSEMFDMSKEYSRDNGRHWMQKLGLRRNMGGKQWTPWTTWTKV